MTFELVSHGEGSQSPPSLEEICFNFRTPGDIPLPITNIFLT